MTTTNTTTKLTIRNTDEEILDALKEAGIKVAKKATRATMVRLLEQAGMWSVHAGSVVPDSYKILYGKQQNCGDDIADLLKTEDVYGVAKANGIDSNEKWGEGRRAKGKTPLNPGMVRMNLGNVLRGRVKRGEYVVIGATEYNEEAKVA